MKIFLLILALQCLAALFFWPMLVAASRADDQAETDFQRLMDARKGREAK